MMAGSGLPIPKSGVLAQSPGVMDGDAISTARSWQQIAASGARLADSAFDYLRHEEQAAKVGRIAERDNADRRKAIELADQFSDDPKGFDAAWKGYSNGVLGSIEPSLVNHSRATLGTLGNTAYANILERRRSRDRAAETESVAALVEGTAADLSATAMRGELGTEKGKATAAKLEGVVESAVTSGIWSRAKADLRLNQALGDAQAEGVLFSAKQAYDENRANGGDALAAARKIVDDRIINNVDLPLSAADRRAYASKIGAELGAQEAVRKQDLSIARKAAQDAQAALTAGVRVSPETIDSLADQLQANGGQADAARLRAAAARSDQVRAFGQQPLARQNEEVLAASSGVSLRLVDRIVGAESSGDPNAKNLNSSATGAGQFIDSTWLDLMRRYRPDRAAGKTDEQVLALRTDGSVSREMVLRYAQENAGALRQAGVAVNDGSIYLAHFLGAGGAIKVLQASPDASIRSIVGDKAYSANLKQDGTFVGGETAGAVRSWAAHKVGLSGGIGAAAEPDLRLARDLQTELEKGVRKDWKKLEADLDAGIRPAPHALSSIITGASLTGDPDLLEEIGDRIDRFDATRQIGQASLGEQRTAASAVQQAGASGTLPPGRAAWLKDFDSVRAATISGLDNDPVALVAQRFSDRFKAPAPLDVTNSANMQAGLRQRAAMVQFGQQAYGTPALSALGPGDLAAVQSILDGQDPTEKLRVVADLTQALPPEVRNATWAKLGQKGPAAALAAFAGGMASVDPQVAQGILRGQTALVAEPRYAPKEGSEGQAFNEALDAALPPVAFGVSDRTGERGNYPVMRAAVRARYADLSAAVGDTSGKVDQNRLQRAADDISGGTLWHAGAPLIAPARGMSQAQFDAILLGITDADLAGVRTLSGTPITAEYLRGNAKLESRFDGVYAVRLNNDPANPQYAVQDSGHPAIPPGRFLLDLRRREPAAIPSWNYIAPASGAAPTSWNATSGSVGGLGTSWEAGR